MQPHRPVLKQPPFHYRPVLTFKNILHSNKSFVWPRPPVVLQQVWLSSADVIEFSSNNKAQRRQEETAEKIRNKEIPRGFISLFKPMSLARCPLLGKSHRKSEINADHLSSPGSWSKDLIGRQHSKIHWSFFFLTWSCRGSFSDTHALGIGFRHVGRREGGVKWH